MSNERQPRRLNTSGAHSTGASHSAPASSGRKISRSGTSAAPSSSARPVQHAPAHAHPQTAQRPAGSRSGQARPAQQRPSQGRPSQGQTYHSSAAQKKRRKKKGGFLKPLLVTLLSIVLVLAVGLGAAYKWVVHSISPEGGMPSIPQIINTPSEFEGDVMNILVCGVDWEDGRHYSNDAQSNDGMTDMIMYVSFDVKNRKISMLQIPRDTYPGEDYKHGKTGKINAVALRNDGMPSLMQLINEQYKLPVDHYVTINMQSLKEIIDLFGGIEVYIPRDISFKGSKLEQGYRNLQGDAAEFFVRNRNYGQGDLARLEMQRYFYQGLFKRIRTATVWDIAKLTPVALKYVETSIPIDDLISLGVSFLKVDSADIMMCKLPTYSAAGGYNGLSVQVCDVAKTTDLLNQYFRTYGGPVNELNVPTLPVAGESSDPNVQYMGQLDTESEGAQPAE